MNENEIMINNEEENPSVEEVTTSGFGFGVAIGTLIGAGGVWVIKQIKKLIAKKAAKENSSDEDTVEVDEFEVHDGPEEVKK